MQENHGFPSQGRWGMKENQFGPNFFILSTSSCSSLLSSRNRGFQHQESYLEPEEFRIQQRGTSHIPKTWGYGTRGHVLMLNMEVTVGFDDLVFFPNLNNPVILWLCLDFVRKRVFNKLSGFLQRAPNTFNFLSFHNFDHRDSRNFIFYWMEVAQALNCPQLNGCSSQGNYHWSGGYRLLCLFLSMPLQRTCLFSLLTGWLFLLIQLLPCSSLFTDSFFSWIAFLQGTG